MKRRIICFFIVLIWTCSMSCNRQQTPEDLGWNLCVGSYTFRLFTFTEALEKVDSLGLKYIEMATSQEIGGGIEGTTAYTMDKSTREAILALSAKHGIKIVSYGVISGKDKSDWEAIFSFVSDMGIQTLLTEPKAEDLDLVEELADKYNVNVAIHNHAKPSRYWNPESVLDAVDGRSKRMGACADVGHWIRSGLDPVECVKKLEGRIIEFHFKDMNQHGLEAHNVIWGTGVVDIKALLKEMQRQGFRGEVTVEYEYNWENSLPEIRESLKNFVFYTKQLNN